MRGRKQPKRKRVLSKRRVFRAALGSEESFQQTLGMGLKKVPGILEPFDWREGHGF